MKIAKIDIYQIAIPFTAGNREIIEVSDDDKFNGASPNIQKMESLLVSITTDTGCVGWGEAFGHAVNPVTLSALESLVSPLFIGSEIELYDDTLYKAKRALHSFGLTGPTLYALSAIDIAVWDIKAKIAEKPLWQLLGGQSGQIELYASLVSYNNIPERVCEQVMYTYQQGFKKIKLHETEFQAIEAARQALPSDAELMVDVNCPWNGEQACQEAKQLAPLNLGWLEEPVWPPEDYIQLAKVRAQGTPLSAGENTPGLQAFANLIASNAVDVIQPSVAKIGGISGMLDVLEMSKDAPSKLVAHCFYYGAGLLATAHFVASKAPDTAVEVPYIQLEKPLHPLNTCPSHFDLGSTPGLGFTPAPELLTEYLITHRVVT
ncbi:MAG: mandelate racemase/muconate lactonizing enzyme family protein [Pontibacterium sp.]